MAHDPKAQSGVEVSTERSRLTLADRVAEARCTNFAQGSVDAALRTQILKKFILA